MNPLFVPILAGLAALGLLASKKGAAPASALNREGARKIPVTVDPLAGTAAGTAAAIKQLQNELNLISTWMGEYPSGVTIAEDGIMGPETQNAVKAFQRLHNLPENGAGSDGSVDPDTQVALLMAYEHVANNPYTG